MLKEYTHNLIELGLSEKEAQVYLVLLNEGSGTADTIAKHAGLNRSTTYVQIEALIDFGLASTFKIGKKTYFAAESPNNLARLLDKKEQNLELQKHQLKDLLPLFMQTFASTGERPVIRTYEGKDGLMTMRTEMANFGGKEILVATCLDDLYKLFTKEELMQYSAARAKNKVTSRVLYNKEGQDMTIVPPQEVRRLPKADFPFGADIYIYGGNVSIASMTGRVFAVTIENKNVAAAFRSLFELAWTGTHH